MMILGKSRVIPIQFGLCAAVLFQLCRAHEHETEDIPEGEAVSAEPLDSILWTHILLQILAFGIIFPTGMVLGIVRSRWHIPVQAAGTVVSILAWFLGHRHKGRQFAPNIHASFASSLMLMLITQIILGIYLKLHLTKGLHARIRKPVVTVHGVIGKLMPVVSWVQMLFGGITALGFCRDDHLGQCLAHFIMGSAFIGYGIIMTILLLVGQIWLRRSGRSQEFFDSCLIAAWGTVNTFTEHRWGQAWRKNDIQHTTMGIVWWCAGLLGIWLSRARGGRPKRNIIPGFVILITGWAMGAHPQSTHLSTGVHTMFGYTLMVAGLTRIVEIAFVLNDSRGLVGEPNSFQYLTPFLLIASGFTFLGATEEMMALLNTYSVTHVSYILILFSFASLLFLFVNMLLHLYAVHAWPSSPTNGRRESRAHSRTPSASMPRAYSDTASRSVSHTNPNGTLAPPHSSHSRFPSGAGIPSSRATPQQREQGGLMNGSLFSGGGPGKGKIRIPRRKHRQTDSEQIRDAETFELEGLISEISDEEAGAGIVSPKD